MLPFDLTNLLKTHVTINTIYLYTICSFTYLYIFFVFIYLHKFNGTHRSVQNWICREISCSVSHITLWLWYLLEAILFYGIRFIFKRRVVMWGPQPISKRYGCVFETSNIIFISCYGHYLLWWPFMSDWMLSILKKKSFVLVGR